MSLRNGHRLFYLCDSVPFGLIGLIDASECPPTFGANRGDVMAFIGINIEGIS